MTKIITKTSAEAKAELEAYRIKREQEMAETIGDRTCPECGTISDYLPSIFDNKRSFTCPNCSCRWEVEYLT